MNPNRVIEVNGKKVSSVQGIVHGGTTYMPVWYVMNVLNPSGIQSKWDGHNWRLTTDKNTHWNSKPVGNGATHIYVDGKLAAGVSGITAVDPNSHKKTTYMPIWYVMNILKAIHINNRWDGTHWNIQVKK